MTILSPSSTPATSCAESVSGDRTPEVSGLRVEPYRPAVADAWDDLVGRSHNGTLMHTRRFIGYHGARFDDMSVVIRDGDRLAGVFPAARTPGRPDEVMSHPGLSYGGLVHDGALIGQRMADALGLIATGYREAGVRSLRYKAVPWIYHRVSAQDDLHALFRLGAQRYRCDLSSTVDIALRPASNALRRRSLRKAARLGVRVTSGLEHVADYWSVLEANLAQRHGATPTHSLAEIQNLIARFPDEIDCAVAHDSSALLGGVLLLRTPQVLHMQYAATTDAGREMSALDPVIERCLDMAAQGGQRFFNFGISTQGSLSELNDSLYRYKHSFGAGGVVQESYELAL